MATPSEFDDIRPYNDEEVVPTLKRLLADNEFLDAVIKLKKPNIGRFASRLMRPLARRAIAAEVKGVDSVDVFQARMEKYLKRALDNSVTELTVSGLEHLNKEGAYCFMSNHRDIAMDPAFVNWTLFQNGFKTLRIAIGDNLLTKPFVSDLMRLNKSFIVNRSLTAPREKLKAAKNLANYMHYSVTEEKANLWIAQREGRAKDGIDKTNPAIVRMLTLAKAKTEGFGEFIQRSNIVPVSISYEWDPCDLAKARELTILKQDGQYKKGEQEDVQSIAMGISGLKGRVHVAFDKPLMPSLEDSDAAAAHLDHTILTNYVLHPSNCIAYEMLEGRSPEVNVTAKAVSYADYDAAAEKLVMEQRLSDCDEATRETFLRMYANPVYSKLKLSAADDQA